MDNLTNISPEAQAEKFDPFNCRARSGAKVQIIAILPLLKFGIVGIIDGDDEIATWKMTGRYSNDDLRESALDLISEEK